MQEYNASKAAQLRQFESYTDWNFVNNQKIFLPPRPLASSDELFKEIRESTNEEREKVTQKIQEYDAFLNEDWRNRKTEREKLGFALSRISPASAYQLAVMEFAETGIALKNKYEDQLRNYRDILNKYSSKKMGKSGSQGIMIGTMKEQKTLDLSDMPKFKFVKSDLSKVMQGNMIDVVLYLFISC